MSGHQHMMRSCPGLVTSRAPCPPSQEKTARNETGRGGLRGGHTWLAETASVVMTAALEFACMVGHHGGGGKVCQRRMWPTHCT
ncbi:hypothetical protein N9L68_02350 [bacterium]|nr:hypothetical protein [bacterium]